MDLRRLLRVEGLYGTYCVMYYLKQEEGEARALLQWLCCVPRVKREIFRSGASPLA